MRYYKFMDYIFGKYYRSYLSKKIMKDFSMMVKKNWELCN